MTSHVFAGDRYRVSARFFHLGELIGTPMMEVDVGETSAGEYSVEDKSHFKIVVLVRPIADGQVYVSMQFSSGKLDVQPNLLVDIGQPRSATIRKVRLNLLVEEIEAEQLKTPELPLQSLTQNVGQSFPE